MGREESGDQPVNELGTIVRRNKLLVWQINSPHNGRSSTFPGGEFMPLCTLEGVPRGGATGCAGTTGIRPPLHTTCAYKEGDRMIVNVTNVRHRTVVVVGQSSDSNCAVSPLYNILLIQLVPVPKIIAHFKIEVL